MLDLVLVILFALLLGLPIASSIWLIVRRRTKVGQWFLSFMITSVVCYVILLPSVWLRGIQLRNELAEYDLDGDGNMADEVMTPEMEQAMDNFFSDTGRTLAPITGLFLCPMYSGFWHFVIGVPYLLFSTYRRRKMRDPGILPEP